MLKLTDRKGGVKAAPTSGYDGSCTMMLILHEGGNPLLGADGGNAAVIWMFWGVRNQSSWGVQVSQGTQKAWLLMLRVRKRRLSSAGCGATTLWVHCRSGTTVTSDPVDRSQRSWRGADRTTALNNLQLPAVLREQAREVRISLHQIPFVVAVGSGAGVDLQVGLELGVVLLQVQNLVPEPQALSFKFREERLQLGLLLLNRCQGRVSVLQGPVQLRALLLQVAEGLGVLLGPIYLLRGLRHCGAFPQADG
mmetsp:Transcript_60017/g.107057  ORF Transcript_60017/g.107057 Transcript_60017/m.107057 type:complete len:251 (+) Transcript_60017:476-1228(+)